jgi:hypothetical protein
MIRVVEGSVVDAGLADVFDFTGVFFSVARFFGPVGLGSSSSERSSALRFFPFTTADSLATLLFNLVLTEVGSISDLGAGPSFSVRRWTLVAGAVDGALSEVLVVRIG